MDTSGLDEVLRKIGRVVVNFQKLEGMLKSLVSVPNYSGSIEQIQSQRVRHLELLRKQSLGVVVADFFDKVYVEDGSEGSLCGPDDYELKITIKGGQERRKLKTLLESIVRERNELIHTRLLGFNPNSTKSCTDLEKFLDAQHERVVPVLEEIEMLFRNMRETRAAFAEVLSNEIKKDGLRSDV